MYAVITTGGKQYRVEQGELLDVEKLGFEAGQTIEFNEVLLLADGFSPQAVDTLIQPPVIANTSTNPSTQAATIYSTWSSGSTTVLRPSMCWPVWSSRPSPC